MKTYLCSMLLTQLSLFTLIVLVTKNKSLRNSKKLWFILSSILIMVCALLEFFGVLLEENSASFRTLLMIVKFMEFSSAPVIPVAFAAAFYPIRSLKTAFIPSGIHVLIEIVSLFGGFIFYIDDNNVYHHGKAYFIYYVFVLISIVYLFHTVVKYGAQYQNRNNLPLIMILIFVLVGVVAHIVDRVIRMTWLAAGMGMILFYVYYCNMVYQIDVLTGLLNRRAFEVREATLKKRAYIVFFDVNNFKSINDRYGHYSGDLCLKYVASAIMKVYQKNGLCYRIGGDEFCAILDRRIHSCRIDELNALFEQELSAKETDAFPMPLVAIGYAFCESGVTAVADAVHQADTRMYLDKTQKKENKSSSCISPEYLL